MEAVSKPSYYAVIPADVRYDDQIPANAKLLYGEISALTTAEGFCFASNEYFQQLYGLSERTVRSLISKLQGAGYLEVELEKDAQTGQVVGRRIWLKVSMSGERPPAIFCPTPGKNLPQGGAENFQPTLDINLSISNIERKNIKKERNQKEKNSGSSTTDFDPAVPFVAWIGQTFGGMADRDSMNALYLAFARFHENRKAIKKPMKTAGAVTALCNKLVKFAGADISRMIELLDDATENGWQSVYDRSGEAPAKKTGGRVYECL